MYYGNLLLKFYKSEIVSKLYSLTINSIRKPWIKGMSLDLVMLSYDVESLSTLRM